MLELEDYLSNRPARWNFWCQWVLATVIAGYTLSSIVYFLTRISDVGSSPLGFYPSFLVRTALNGVIQSLVLSRYISGFKWWVLASILGAIVGLALYAVLGLVILIAFLDRPVENSLAMTVGLSYFVIPGTTVAVAQRLVLRRYVYKSGWWILINIVSLIAGVVLSTIIYHIPRNVLDTTVIGTATQILRPVGFAAIEASVLVWLLRSRR